MRRTCIFLAVLAVLTSYTAAIAAQTPAPKPKKVKKDIFTVQCQYGAADSSRAPIGMLYGMSAVDAALRVRGALQSAGLQLAKDGVLYWTTSPVTSWPAGPRGDPWRAYAYPGVYTTLILGQKADTIVLLGSVEPLCATSPGAPDSTIAMAVKLFAEDLTEALQRNNPMPNLAVRPPTDLPRDQQSVRYSSVAAGLLYTCALSREGQAFCWGTDNGGQLGNANRAEECEQIPCSTAPRPVQTDMRFVSLAAGAVHVCGLTQEGEAFCWGNNAVGQLGNDTIQERCGPTRTEAACSTVPIPVLGGGRFRSIAAGGFHTCGLTSDGRAQCWGQNVAGQLGRGGSDTLAHPLPRPVDGDFEYVALTAGSEHSCALRPDGRVLCWGADNNDQLGSGQSIGICQEGFAPCAVAPIEAAAEMTFTAIQAGGRHTCGLTADSTVYCWGANDYGQSGAPPGPTPGLVDPHRISTKTRFVSLAAGGSHTCALSAGGEAYCWGLNWLAQLGNQKSDKCPNRTRRGAGGNVECSPKPLLVTRGIAFQQISGGQDHTCGLSTDGRVYCWGFNRYRQLGVPLTGERCGEDDCVSKPLPVSNSR